MQWNLNANAKPAVGPGLPDAPLICTFECKRTRCFPIHSVSTMPKSIHLQDDGDEDEPEYDDNWDIDDEQEEAEYEEDEEDRWVDWEDEDAFYEEEDDYDEDEDYRNDDFDDE